MSAGDFGFLERLHWQGPIGFLVASPFPPTIILSPSLFILSLSKDRAPYPSS